MPSRGAILDAAGTDPFVGSKARQGLLSDSRLSGPKVFCLRGSSWAFQCLCGGNDSVTLHPKQMPELAVLGSSVPCEALITAWSDCQLAKGSQLFLCGRHATSCAVARLQCKLQGLCGGLNSSKPCFP